MFNSGSVHEIMSRIGTFGLCHDNSTFGLCRTHRHPWSVLHRYKSTLNRITASHNFVGCPSYTLPLGSHNRIGCGGRELRVQDRTRYDDYLRIQAGVASRAISRLGGSIAARTQMSESREENSNRQDFYDIQHVDFLSI
jgi:hypothetical protein